MSDYPKDWGEVQLKDIFIVTRGKVLATNKVRKNNTGAYKYPVYSSQTLNKGLLGYYNKYLFENSITWTTDGANAGDTNFREGKFYCTNVCGVLINNEGYSNYCVASIINSISRNYVSYVGNPKLMNNVVKNIEITIPPLPEQKAIADTLTIFDKHIENLEKLIEKKKMIRDGALEDLMSGKIRLDGFNGEWEEKQIFVLLEVLNGLTYSPEDVKKNGVLVLRSSNIKDDRLVFTDNVYVDERKIYSSKVKNGDIIMCVRNGSASLIGKTALVRDEINATIGAFMSNLRCHEFINNVFVYYFFKTTKFKDEIDKILGATINQITKSDLKKIIISYPTDIKEQEAIAAILTSMDDEIEDLEKEKAKIENLKAGAMYDLLTGRVRLI